MVQRYNADEMKPLPWGPNRPYNDGNPYNTKTVINVTITTMITITNQINHRPLDLVFAVGSRIRPKNTNGFYLGPFPIPIYTSVNVDYRC
jgi:hypothetical protein